MAIVTIKGIYMDAQVRTTNFNNEEKTNLYMDLYQKDSTVQQKLVQLKTKDISLINVLNKDFAQGSEIEVQASVTGYKNQAYFTLLSIKTPALTK